MAAALGKRRLFVHLPTPLVVGAGRALGTIVRQELITDGELRSTMEGLADTDGPATGDVSVLDWLIREFQSAAAHDARGR